MRLVLAALIAVVGASAASAEAVQDRYGPPRKAVDVAALGPGAYNGPLLGWAGKAAAHVEAPAPPAQPPARQVPAPQAYAPQPAAPAIPAPQFTPQNTRQYASRPVQAAPVAMRPAEPAAIRPATTAAAPAAFDPRPQLAGGPPPATQAAPAAVSRPTATPRYYSLHREYGRAPDAIPPQVMAPRYVLIGPPDPPSAPVDQDGESTQSSGQF